MRAKICLLLIFGVYFLWAADKPQHLEVKPGLWEVTRTTRTLGEMPIPAELLATLTPEQRSRMQERMKARSPERTTTTTEKNCLTKEQLEKGPTFGENRENCTQTIIGATNSKMEIKLVCQQEAIRSEGTLEFEALGPTNVKGSGHMVFRSGTRTMNSSSTVTAKWIGPACGDIP